jgi:hypothetical protein
VRRGSLRHSELKKPGVPARAAFDENLTHYKQQIPALFWFNALLITSMLAARNLRHGRGGVFWQRHGAAPNREHR